MTARGPGAPGDEPGPNLRKDGHMTKQEPDWRHINDDTRRAIEHMKKCIQWNEAGKPKDKKKGS